MILKGNQLEKKHQEVRPSLEMHNTLVLS